MNKTIIIFLGCVLGGLVAVQSAQAASPTLFIRDFTNQNQGSTNPGNTLRLEASNITASAQICQNDNSAGYSCTPIPANEISNNTWASATFSASCGNHMYQIRQSDGQYSNAIDYTVWNCPNPTTSMVVLAPTAGTYYTGQPVEIRYCAYNISANFPGGYAYIYLANQNDQNRILISNSQSGVAPCESGGGAVFTWTIGSQVSPGSYTFKVEYRDIYGNTTIQPGTSAPVTIIGLSTPTPVYNPNCLIWPRTEIIRQTKLYSISEICDGDLIRANGDIAVYIVKIQNGKYFIRRFFGPQIFRAYPHLGFSKVKVVTPETLSQFTPSVFVKLQSSATIMGFVDVVPGVSARLTPTISYVDPDAVYIINSAEYRLYR